VFGRSRTDETEGDNDVAAETTASEEDRSDRPGAKNRPTPKRRDQEAARKQPLVQTDRKAARKADRDRRRASQHKTRQAMVTGDDRYLPARDKGPVRRYVRDYVDARRSLGEYLLPLMLAVLLLSLVAAQWATLVFILVYAVLIAAIIDAVIMWRRIRPRLLAEFGEDTDLRGLSMYAVMRAFQLRRTRMPKPQVERGQFPG
jgi:Flp pilus assembly protein TadB